MDIVFVIDATGSMSASIQAARDKAVDLAFDLHIHNRDALFSFGCVCYRDPVDSSDDEHEVFDLVDQSQSEELEDWLGTQEAKGGGDGPEDYVGAFDCIFNRIHWREGSKRALIWIADAPAHGERYCGRENHQEEEPKLQPLVAKIAEEGYYFVGLNIHGGATQTFREMKAIYDSKGGRSFVVQDLNPETGNEVGRISETMMTSVTSVVGEMKSLAG